MLFKTTVQSITMIIIVVLSTRPSFLAYLDVWSKNYTLVNKAKGVAPRARPLTKMINNSYRLSLNAGLINLAINPNMYTLITLPTISIKITIAQNTYECVIGLSGSY